MRLISFVLALAMMLAVAPVSAFAAEEPTPIDKDSLTFDANGLRVAPDNKYLSTANNTYYYPKNDTTCQWASPAAGSVALRHGYSFGGAGSQVIMEPISVAGVLTGGIYGNTVTVYNFSNGGSGKIEDGVFQGKVQVSDGEITGGLFLGTIAQESKGNISGGVFVKDPGNTATTKHTLKAPGCKLYTESAYTQYKDLSVDAVSDPLSSAAYIVGEQTIVLKLESSTLFDHWEVKANNVVTEVDASNTTYKSSEDADGNHILTFKVQDSDVEVTPVVTPIAFHIGESGLPEYNGEPYMGVLALDGWHLSENANGANYSYVLTVKQGATVDFENNVIPANWAFSNYGTLKNGILPGNVVNRECTSTTYGDDLGKYGRVENIAFKMNVNFGDQDPNITWVTLKNATACEVFPDIVGVIGKQTITIKPTISADLFQGWVVGGDISDELAEQIEKQKDSDTLVLNLDGENKDRIAVAAKTEGDTFGVKMLDGKATVDGQTITAALPGQTVTITMDDSEIPEGMSFDHWVVNPDVELEGGFKATDRTTSFTMPTEELTIYASLRTDSDDGMDATTVLVGVAVGAGAAYLGYTVGTELYAKQVLGDGVAIPRTRADVALKAWELAGKPTVAIDGEPLSEAAQAEKWAVESGLMQNVDGSFNGQKKMSKLKALRTLDSAKKMGAQ